MKLSYNDTYTPSPHRYNLFTFMNVLSFIMAVGTDYALIDDIARNRQNISNFTFQIRHPDSYSASGPSLVNFCNKQL